MSKLYLVLGIRDFHLLLCRVGVRSFVCLLVCSFVRLFVCSFVVRCSLFVVRCSLFVVRCSLFVRPSFVVRGSIARSCVVVVQLVVDGGFTFASSLHLTLRVSDNLHCGRWRSVQLCCSCGLLAVDVVS